MVFTDSNIKYVRFLACTQTPANIKAVLHKNLTIVLKQRCDNNIQLPINLLSIVCMCVYKRERMPQKDFPKNFLAFPLKFPIVYHTFPSAFLHIHINPKQPTFPLTIVPLLFLSFIPF